MFFESEYRLFTILVSVSSIHWCKLERYPSFTVPFLHLPIPTQNTYIEPSLVSILSELSYKLRYILEPSLISILSNL